MQIDQITTSRFFVYSDPILKEFKYQNYHWDFIQRKWWSRIFEYEWLRQISKLRANTVKNSAIDLATGNKHPGALILKENGFATVHATDLIDPKNWHLKDVNEIHYHMADLTQDIIGSYDFVSCISVLEHLTPEQQIQGLRNICRHVNHNGWLALTFDFFNDQDWSVNVETYRKILEQNHMFITIEETKENERVCSSKCEWAKKNIRANHIYCYRMLGLKIC